MVPCPFVRIYHHGKVQGVNNGRVRSYGVSAEFKLPCHLVLQFSFIFVCTLSTSKPGATPSMASNLKTYEGSDGWTIAKFCQEIRSKVTHLRQIYCPKFFCPSDYFLNQVHICLSIGLISSSCLAHIFNPRFSSHGCTF